MKISTAGHRDAPLRSHGASRRFHFILLCTMILLFEPLFPGSARAAAMPGVITGTTGTAVGAAAYTGCVMCGLTERIETSSRTFRERSFKALVGPAAGFGRLLSLIWLYLFVAGLFLQPSKAPELVFGLLSRIGWLLAMVGIFAAPDWILSNVINAGERTFMGLAGFVLGVVQQSYSGSTASVPSLDSASWYSELWRQVERTIFPLLLELGRGATPNGLLDISVLPRLLLIVILAIPYTFVLGIFLAFMMQVIFYCSAITAVGPLLVLGLPWSATRGYLTGGIKFMVGGGLTLVFASIAMGTTGSMLNDQFNRVKLAAPTDQGMQALLSITNVEYWYTLIVGFISVLLHLAAPRIASNLGGVTDSATSAAMVTAAGQFAGGKAVGAAGGMLFGGGSRAGLDPGGGAGGLVKGLLGATGGKAVDTTLQRGALGLGVMGAGAIMGAGRSAMASAFKAAYRGTRGGDAPGGSGG